MNRNKIAALAVAGVCLSSIIDYQKTRRAEIKKREEIQAKLAKDLHAIRIGSLRVQEAIRNGTYMPRNLHELQETMQFEYIIAYNE